MLFVFVVLHGSQAGTKLTRVVFTEVMDDSDDDGVSRQQQQQQQQQQERFVPGVRFALLYYYYYIFYDTYFSFSRTKASCSKDF
jgi:hypothetical protein